MKCSNTGPPCAGPVHCAGCTGNGYGPEPQVADLRCRKNGTAGGSQTNRGRLDTVYRVLTEKDNSPQPHCQ